MLVPDLLGGSGSFGLPATSADYNLTEVTGYAGLLPVVAATALLGRGVRNCGCAAPPEWLVWHVVGAGRISCSRSAATPRVGRLLVHLPLFSGQRLQSRNILVLDLALAVLLAYWADEPFGAGDRRFLRLRGRRGPDLETVLALLPPLAVLAVVTLGLCWGAGLLRWLRVSSGATSLDGLLKPGLVPYVLIAVGAIAFVIVGRRLRPVVRCAMAGRLRAGRPGGVHAACRGCGPARPGQQRWQAGHGGAGPGRGDPHRRPGGRSPDSRSPNWPPRLPWPGLSRTWGIPGVSRSTTRTSSTSRICPASARPT